MTDDRKSGYLLILGSLGGIVTMAIHPSGRIVPAQVEHLATVSAIAHSLAMVSFLAVFLGSLGLTVRLTRRDTQPNRDRLALAGLVVFGFGCLALLIATAVSGFIWPSIMRMAVADPAANLPEWTRLLRATFEFNQAFARIYSVAACFAITLWSVSALRHGGLRRGIAVYGCILPPMVALLIAVGHLRLNVHGMAAVVIVHTIWFVTAAFQIMRD